MTDISCFSNPLSPPVFTIATVLASGRGSDFETDCDAIERRTIPEWSPRFASTSTGPVETRPVFETLIMAMAAAGRSVAVVSLTLGLAEAEVRETIASLGLPDAPEKPLRRSGGANPWSVVEVRQLIALWFDKVSVGSIATSLGRSNSSIRGKRRWLGLGVRNRKGLSDRAPAKCRVIALPWEPKVDVSKIVAWLTTPSLRRAPAPIPVKVEWALGRDAEKDARFSILGFAGLTAPVIAERMRIEFGVVLTVSAVNTRLGRLQVARDRWSLTNEFDEQNVQHRAAERMREVGAVLRHCVELHRSFWWRRKLGGSRSICREFETSARYAGRRAERSYGDVTAMAA
jgi:hypothetical protein